MTLITHCPSCHVAFHATATQLKVANGLVRCGACLKVFDATLHQRADSPATWQDTPANQAPAPEDTIPLPLDEKPDNENSGTKAASSASTTSDPDPISDTDANKLPESGIAIDKSDTTAPIESALSETHSKTVDCEPNQINQGFPTELPDHAGSAIDPIAASVEAPWSNEILESEQSRDSSRTRESSNPAALDDLVDNALFTAKRSARQPARPWLAAASLLAILLLPLQYIYFYSDQLSLDPDNRRWLIPLCRTLQCHISHLVNLSEIKSDHLLVYSHPSTDGALLVEAVLENRADFAQPFPNLLLYFDNLQGQRVAQRLFTPKEYLHGELDGFKTFPRNQPVRIRLEIIDPGPDASSYSLLVTN